MTIQGTKEGKEPQSKIGKLLTAIINGLIPKNFEVGDSSGTTTQRASLDEKVEEKATKDRIRRSALAYLNVHFLKNQRGERYAIGWPYKEVLPI